MGATSLLVFRRAPSQLPTLLVDTAFFHDVASLASRRSLRALHRLRTLPTRLLLLFGFLEGVAVRPVEALDRGDRRVQLTFPRELTVQTRPVDASYHYSFEPLERLFRISSESGGVIRWM